ncbi:isochorismatase family protein [Enhygromyxa salina]|uniref:Isochorismatase family protein n=1 Tax=Enhygromyxa salina TaxID=215803 RepID=A0A2S9XPK2_9BACT|nr:Isochorismatase family protein [Enhygromyxa salina]
MSSPANFNGSKPTINSDDAVILLIDHQSGLFQLVEDTPMSRVRANVTVLAKAATLANIPVITTASVPQGPNGPMIPEIQQYARHATYVPRRGEIDAWDNPEFVAAVKATGRHTLIMAGVLTSVCVAFPAIAAAHDGYKVFAVFDASGDYSKMAQEVTLARLMQAGVVPIDTAAALAEVQGTWNRGDAQAWAELFACVAPSYQLLLESHHNAQEVERNQEPLDSQRK